MNKLKKEALGKGVNPLIIDAMDSDGYVELYNGNRVSYSRVIVLGDDTFVDCDDSCIVAAVDDGGYYFSEDAWYCSYSGDWYSPKTTMYNYYDGLIAESVLGASEVVWCEYMEAYINKDNAVYCEDVRGFVLKDHAYYSPADDYYVYYKENVKKAFCIVDYGEISNFEDLNDNKSPYSIGFEIEKTDFLGARFIDDYVGEYPLFAGYMLDSSCGVEGVTHILPLSTDYYVRNFVFEMIYGDDFIL